MKKYGHIAIVMARHMENIGYLKEYIIDHAEKAAFFFFPLSYDNDILIEKYENGKRVSVQEIPDLKVKSKLLRNIYYYFRYWRFVLQELPRKEQWTIITTYPLFCVGNTVARWMKKTNHVFWILDHFPSDSFVMKIYNGMVRFYSRRLQYVLYLSQWLSKEYPPANSSKYRDILPLAIKKNQLQRPQPEEKIILGYIGIVRKLQGMEILFESLQNNPNLTLEVIGAGIDYEHYYKLGHKMGVAERITWHQDCTDDKQVQDIMSRWHIGCAPYQEGNIVCFGDPGKLKFYFSFGLPVITTSVAPTHKEISDIGAGEIIGYHSQGLDEAIANIAKNYDTFTKGVEKLADKYDYVQLHDTKLSFLQLAG